MVSEIKFDPESGDFTINEDVNHVQRIAHRLANHGKPYAGTAPYWGEDRHVYLGGDEINGDHLGIDFQPVSYTPTPDAVYSDCSKHLSAHLNGIDDRFASSGHFLTIHVDPNVTTQITGKLYNNLYDAVDYVNAGVGSADRYIIDLLPGTYTLSTSIINISQNCLIRGSGMGQTILDFTVLPLGNDYAIDFLAVTWGGVENLTVRVRSSLVGGVRIAGTLPSAASQFIVRDVALEKVSANDSAGVYALDINFLGGTGKGFIEIDNLFIDCRTNYWQNGVRILFSSETDVPLSVSDVVIDGVYGNAMYLDSCKGYMENVEFINCGRDPSVSSASTHIFVVLNSGNLALSGIRADKNGGGEATTGYGFLFLGTGSDGITLAGLQVFGTATNAFYYGVCLQCRAIMSDLDIYQLYSGGSSFGVYFTTGSDDSSMNNFGIRGFSRNLYIDTLIDFITVANGVCRNRSLTKGADCRFNSVHFEDTLVLGESGLGSDYRVNNSLNGCHFSGNVSGYQGRATFSGCHLEPNSVQYVRFRDTMTNAILTGCSFKPGAVSGTPTPINAVTSMVYFECQGSVVGCIQYDNPVIGQATWAYIRFATGAEGVIANNTFMSISDAANRQGSFIDVSATANENVAIANNVCDVPAGVVIGTNGIEVSGTANTVVTVTGNIMPTIAVNAPVPANRSNNIPAP